MHTIAATAVALRKAAEPAFRDYGRQVLANAQALAQALLNADVTLVTGGTDNHLLVLNTIDSFGLDGRQAETVLDQIGITANKQVVPDDPRPPLRPSGLRIGTPAATTRGMREDDMRAIAAWMVQALRHPDDAALLARLAGEVHTFCRRFPLPGVAAA
jgi:glycine hydroxymethyltransferase